MNDEDLGKLIYHEIVQADGWDSGELNAHREAALKAYFNDPRGDEVPGESHVQSSDVADMVNAVLAQLTPMISTDALVQFEPSAEADEDQARMETRAVNNAVMDKNSGYVSLQECLKNASLCRNAFAKVWAEDMETVEVREFSNRTKGDLNRMVSVMNERPGIDAEIESYDEKTRTGKIQVKSTTRRFKWKAVDPINVLFQPEAKSLDLQELRFFAEVDFPTRSQLKQEGYDPKLVDDLPTHSLDTRIAANRRNRSSENPIDAAGTEDQERVERHECYLLCDMDGDGISERWQVIVGGNQGDSKTVLHKEQVQWTPYAAGTLFIAPHRLEGEDLYDRLRQTQDIKTATYRRLLDNLGAATWAKTVVGPGIDPGEYEDGRAGVVIKCKGVPAENVFIPPFTDIGASALQLMQYEDTRRTERAGAALDMQSADAQLVGETMGGIMKQYSVKEALAAMMAKNIAETLIREIYLLFHRTLRAFSNAPISVNMRGEWQQIDPVTWPARESVNVIPGLTPGQREAVKAAMATLIQWQAQAVQAGLSGQVVTLKNMYRTAIDFVRASGVDNPEGYLTDPQSPEAVQAGRQASAQAQQQQQMMQQMAGMQFQLEQAKLQLQRYEADQSARVDVYKANLDAELKEAELVQEGVTNAQDAAERARSQTSSGSSAGNGAASFEATS